MLPEEACFSLLKRMYNEKEAGGRDRTFGYYNTEVQFVSFKTSTC